VSCTSNGQCGSGLCSGGACCASACNGTCQNGACDGNGNCTYVDVGTQCGTRVLGTNQWNTGYNNILLYCNAQHACVGPSVSCGFDPNKCDLTTNACCQNQPSSSFNVTCTQPSLCCDGATNCGGNSDQRWYGCKSNFDCPNNMTCCAYVNWFGTYGIQFAECQSSCTNPFNGLMCDPTRSSPSQCPSGTACNMSESDTPDYNTCY
jgi:hypothetical protein